jgi:hypothetical protein
VLAAAAGLPQPVVGLVPRLVEEVEQGGLERPRLVNVRGREPSTSPYTSSWNCPLAALPTRTGADPS